MPSFDGPITYTIELDLTNYGYSLAKKKDVSLKELTYMSKEEVNKVDISIHYFEDDVSVSIPGSRLDELYTFYNVMNIYSQRLSEEKLDKYDGVLSFVDKNIDHKVLLYKLEDSNTELNKYASEVLEELENKYNEKFIGVRRKKLVSINDTGSVFALQ